MNKADVIAHFGSQEAAAQALGIKQPSVAAWTDYPPPLRQLQIEAITNGALKAETDCDMYRVPAKVTA